MGLLDGRLLVEQNARAEAVQQAKAPVVLHIASHAFSRPSKAKARKVQVMTRCVLACRETAVKGPLGW